VIRKIELAMVDEVKKMIEVEASIAKKSSSIS